LFFHDRPHFAKLDAPLMLHDLGPNHQTKVFRSSFQWKLG